mgnify:CR=1 FL=1
MSSPSQHPDPELPPLSGAASPPVQAFAAHETGPAEGFAMVMRYANDVILLIDENLRIVEASDRACEVYGYTNAEMLTLKVPDLRAAGAADMISRDFARADRRLGLGYRQERAGVGRLDVPPLRPAPGGFRGRLRRVDGVRGRGRRGSWS